jgi:tetratricopeptide (TPR) repeat protein
MASAEGPLAPQVTGCGVPSAASVSETTAHPISRRGRGRWKSALGLFAGLILLAASWNVIVRYENRSVEEGLKQARAELENGLPATAAERLRNLAKAHPGYPEILFRLGLCELSIDRVPSALAAWASVPVDSEWFPAASAERGNLLLNNGRYRPAEDCLANALTSARRPADIVLVRRALSRLYRFEGRIDDVRRLLRESFYDSTDRVGLLRELWLLDTAPQPVESWRHALEQADPEDDRVWLGFANVSIMTSKLDEAARWLERCEAARPDDPAVRRARLDLALAIGDEFGVWKASVGLPAEALRPSEPLAIQAWLLSRRDDRTAERASLQALISADPSRIEPLDRLAALEMQAGHRKEADCVRRRKSELDQAKDQFRKLLLGESDLAAKASEFARLATILGRTFDAWAWSVVSGRAFGTTPQEADPQWSLAHPRDHTGTLADRLLALGLKSESSPSASISKREIVTPASIPRFTETAESSGLKFVFDSGQTPLRQLPETMSGGVGVLDFDGDGWLDVYVVQGGPISSGSNPSSGTDRLFRNRRDGTFEDVTESSRIASFPRDYALGVAVGDYDGDGRPDLFISRLTSYALYRNNGDGTFSDATETAGLAGRRDNPTSAAFADLDGDGDLDLYVCHYMIWDPADPRLCKNEKGEYFYCDPSRVSPAPDHLFRNDRGRFTDVTAEAGITDLKGRGLGVVAADFDDDGRVDLFVANDGTGNYLFRNLGGFRFEEIGLASGVSCGTNGGYQASMGVACGDYNGDGRPDLLVTNFYGESSTLSENLGAGMFRDATSASGVGAATRHLLGFGTSFADLNNDGRLDLVTANGHVNDDRPFYPYAMPAQLLLGQTGDRFVDVSRASGEAWMVPRVGRGLAVADLDNDGRLDVLILSQNSELALFHNDGATDSGQFLTLQLEGVASNRDGVGAVVTIVADGRRQVAQRIGGGSYQSACDPRIHFGLGRVTTIDSIEVRWPSGTVDRHRRLRARTGYQLKEGSRVAQPLPGFQP